MGLSLPTPARPRHAAAHQRVPVQRYITALVNKKEVKKGQKVTIYGAVDALAPRRARSVWCSTSSARPRARSTSSSATVTTDGTGAYSVKAEGRSKKSRFRISAPATDACTEAQSPPRTVKIKESAEHGEHAGWTGEQIRSRAGCRRT